MHQAVMEYLIQHWSDFIISYLVISMLLFGWRGGIRDGVEGIGDVFVGFGWPIWVIFYIITLPYWIGYLAKKSWKQNKWWL